MKADIFFVISSVATVILAVLASVLLFYLIKAGKNLYRLSEALKSGYKESGEFVTELRERLENNIIFRLFFPPVRRKRQPPTNI
jgi:beta-lactamase regulating signal transducer with metallopeptidase domain